MKRLPAWVALAAVLAPAAPADGDVWLSLAADQSGYECDVADPGPGGTVTVYVLALFGEDGVAGVRFHAPVPDGAGLVHLGDTSTFPTLGSSQTDISIGFGSCPKFNRLVILEMRFMRLAGGQCTFYRLTPHPAYGAIYADCHYVHYSLRFYDGVVLNSDGSCQKVTPPHNPGPADGATGVPQVTELTWDFDRPLCEVEISGRQDYLGFGLDPDPVPSTYTEVTSPHAVGPLEPGTRYYWRLLISAYGHGILGPVWTFTTSTDVATQPSTWGRIKALYR